MKHIRKDKLNPEKQCVVIHINDNINSKCAGCLMYLIDVIHHLDKNVEYKAILILTEWQYIIESFKADEFKIVEIQSQLKD